MIVEPDHVRESPRCLSRESSGAPRCPSNDSVYSSRSGAGIPLPAALTAALPAALLPPHSAAVAAYLGAAAAAAQQRLLMSCQEDMTDSERADAVLDFSTKRSDSPHDDDDPDDAVNLSKNENGPLDLSVGTRKRGLEDSPSPVPSRKSSRTADFKPTPSSWSTPVTPHFPYFAAAVAAASLSPKGGIPGDWNGKQKHGPPTPNEATKALEKLGELSRLGGEELFRSVQSAALGAGLAPNAAARHSAWQSHWLNKGADQTKDVLKCVWCKKSFNSLADLTVHMKEAKHCGVNVPVPPTTGAPIPPSLQPPPSSPSTPSHNSSSSSGSSKPNQSDLNMLIKENMPIPRKLVRGQDVWLGKGAEQTRQILKCMWCAESFRSLAEMTSHMQRTQHYTNIISQEQIISWKSSDDGSKGSNSSAPGANNAVPPPTGTSSHVSAVLTCKVCDQAFSSLKELSNHMVKNSHYKEHIMRSITESGGRRRQTREKRKKSLPVRKLLELERAQHEFKNGDGNGVPMGKPIRDYGAGSRITCEKCGDKIETAVFVEHIRQCIGAPMSNSQRNFLKSALLSNNIIPPDVPGHVTPTGRDGRKSINEELPSPGSTHHRSPSSINDSSPGSKDPNASNDKSSSPSVLNAIEQLIEKSFDTRSRHTVPGMPGGASHAPIGSSILKRLGIDESVDYTKPLVDPQTMNMLRNYHHQQGYGRRERSGSESSSMSERGGSRVESLTPDRKLDTYHMTPRTTPDTRGSQTPASEDRPAEVRIKREVEEEERENGVDLSSQPVRVKTEVDEEEEPPRPGSTAEEDVKPIVAKRESEGPSPAASPRSPASDRSGNTPGVERKPASSLGALSSMFDNLTGGGPSSEPSSSRRGGSHPLAALQKLCDKTETNPSRAPVPAPSPAGPPSILTFSWACNDAVVTDSIMKCALCDTPFISKGAYRHHLSKMHFVKDGALPEPVPLKAPAGAASPGGHKSGSTAPSPQDPRSPSQSFDESPHSKFLKYTELAKQLSSKYV